MRKGHYGVVVLERATWHRSGDLKVPANLSLLHLPPYSPELNPMGNVYNHLKTNYHANRFFETLEDVSGEVKKLIELVRKEIRWSEIITFEEMNQKTPLFIMTHAL